MAGETWRVPSRLTACTWRWPGCVPAREYFYRFESGREESAVGPDASTAPAPGTQAPLRFAFASCQHYEHGFYTAYRHMADEDLDVVLHLGDYIYEFGPRGLRGAERGGAHLQQPRADRRWTATALATPSTARRRPAGRPPGVPVGGHLG